MNLSPSPRRPAQDASHAVAYRGITIATAATRGDLAQVVLLWGMAIAQNLNPLLPDEEGNTVLHWAALAETPEVATFILQQKQALDGDGSMLGQCNMNGETPLLFAATAGHLPTIQFLLAQGSDVAAVGTVNGNTIFHNVCREGHLWALHHLVEHAIRTLSYENAMQLLLQVDGEGHTCLNWACFGGHVAVVQYLLRLPAGFKATGTDNKGRTGLHLASCMKQEGVCRYLVSKAGVSPFLKDAMGKDAFAYAQDDQAVLAALRGEKKRPTTRDMEVEEGKPNTIDNSLVRPSTIRVRILITYAFLTALLWTLPFVLAWYFVLPLFLFLTAAYRRTLGFCHTLHPVAEHGGGNDPTKPKPRATRASQFFLAHERHIGIWCGTVLAFAITVPFLREWPRSVLSWSQHHAETATAISNDGAGNNNSTLSYLVSTPVMLAMYASLAATGLLWWDLVFHRPNPGVVSFEDGHYEALLAHVIREGAPPSVQTACHTCMVRKPLRSKHCRSCGYCVARMDHHCIWLDGCVGVANHGRFITFVFFHLVSVVLFLTCTIPVLHATIQHALPSPLHDASQVLRVLMLRPIFPLLLQSLFALGTATGLCFLFQQQCHNVLTNLTGNERLNGARYAWITDPTTGRYNNRFDRGSAWGNLKEFVGCCGTDQEQGVDYRKCYELPRAAVPLDNNHTSRKQCDGRCSHTATATAPTPVGGEEKKQQQEETV